jgi:hypothetical protein
MSTGKIFLGGKAQLAQKAENLTTNFHLIYFALSIQGM